MENQHEGYRPASELGRQVEGARAMRVIGESDANLHALCHIIDMFPAQ